MCKRSRISRQRIPETRGRITEGMIREFELGVNGGRESQRWLEKRGLPVGSY